MTAGAAPVLLATGLLREARILAGPGVTVVAGGGDHARLEAALDRLAPGARGILSIGIAGALAPGLRPGDWVVADNGTDPGWATRLAALLPGARSGPILGMEAMVAEAAGKAALHRETGALAVDMESHVAARVARRHNLPFAAARAISDAADRSLPPAARVGMRPDGGMDLPAVLRDLARDPRQIPALIRTGWEAERGFRALLRGRDRLGPGLAAP
ncbi:phosphorylase family protein [Muricoccus pecuniae]|uniref:Hopanoid-associated phosphorylase n=1 Tax=Muricoccus pecuniae TaxID=693023 RepID=A0A840XUU4_9PROT|nr:hopanoid-associated phosphorylase [Roseomonas pecuniae]MBB5692305.1 hopanoid-associated phosphorylase [Roseomonas pecuniae]